MVSSLLCFSTLSTFAFKDIWKRISLLLTLPTHPGWKLQMEAELSHPNPPAVVPFAALTRRFLHVQVEALCKYICDGVQLKPYPLHSSFLPQSISFIASSAVYLPTYDLQVTINGTEYFFDCGTFDTSFDWYGRGAILKLSFFEGGQERGCLQKISAISQVIEESEELGNDSSWSAVKVRQRN